MHETQVRSLVQKDPLEEGMAIQSSILAWRIPWTEEAGRLQSMESESHVTEQLTLSLFFFFFHWSASALLVSPASLLTDRAPEHGIGDP